MKKILTALISTLLLFAVLCSLVISPSALSLPSPKISWKFDEESGVLTIHGSREMENYTATNRPEWDAVKNQVITVIISHDVKSIGDYAFYQFENLEFVHISNTVTRIGTGAFANCKSLISMDLPGFVAEIGVGCFEECISLKQVNLPEGLKRIPPSAFHGCSQLAKIDIPHSVEEIGVYAFRGCEKLEEISLPNSNIDFEEDAFAETAYVLNEENWQGGVLYIGNHLMDTKHDLTGSYQVKEGTRTIATLAFASCKQLSEITLPNSIQMIGSYAFSRCSNLSKIHLPDSIKEIQDGAFEGCSSLTEVCLPNSLSTLSSKHLFYGCKNLKTVILPLKMQTIGEAAFYGCTSLSSINYVDAQGVTHVNALPPNVTGIQANAFYRCTSLSTIEIPQKMRLIDKAFVQCTALEKITFHCDAVALYTFAFQDCTALKTITMKAGKHQFKIKAFANCPNLTTVEFCGTKKQWDSFEKNELWNYQGKRNLTFEYHASTSQPFDTSRHQMVCTIDHCPFAVSDLEPHSFSTWKTTRISDTTVQHTRFCYVCGLTETLHAEEPSDPSTDHKIPTVIATTNRFELGFLCSISILALWGILRLLKKRIKKKKQ